MKFSFDEYNKKRFTFLLATKNRPKFLAKALKNHRKVISQYDELIVIEGDPESGSREVIKKFSDIVDIFICERDFSEGEALNKGVLLAKGKYIKLLTDDDIFFAGAIDRAVKVMEEHPEIDVLLCGGVKSKGKEIFFAYVPPGANYGKDVADVFKYGGNGLGMVIRRKSFAKIGLFSTEALSLDNDFLSQAIYKGANVRFCRINMFHHFLEGHSVTVLKPEAVDRDRERIKKKYKVDEDLIWKLRIKISQMIFPLLPEGFQVWYKSTFKNPRTAKFAKIKPVWDGGFS